MALSRCKYSVQILCANEIGAIAGKGWTTLVQADLTVYRTWVKALWGHRFQSDLTTRTVKDPRGSANKTGMRASLDLTMQITDTISWVEIKRWLSESSLLLPDYWSIVWVTYGSYNFHALFLLHNAKRPRYIGAKLLQAKRFARTFPNTHRNKIFSDLRVSLPLCPLVPTLNLSWKTIKKAWKTRSVVVVLVRFTLLITKVTDAPCHSVKQTELLLSWTPVIFTVQCTHGFYHSLDCCTEYIEVECTCC